MLNYIRGILIKKQPTLVILECADLAFNVHIPISTYDYLPSENEKFKLFTHLEIKENSQKIFGFWTEDEKNIFKLLISVSGIGPKAALALLSNLSVEDLLNAIGNEKTDILVKAPGIGPKSAKRIIIDLKDKVNKLKLLKLAKPKSEHLGENFENTKEEAILALISLGYPKSKAKTNVDKVFQKIGEESIETIIRETLKIM